MISGHWKTWSVALLGATMFHLVQAVGVQSVRPDNKAIGEAIRLVRTHRMNANLANAASASVLVDPTLLASQTADSAERRRSQREQAGLIGATLLPDSLSDCGRSEPTSDRARSVRASCALDQGKYFLDATPPTVTGNTGVVAVRLYFRSDLARVFPSGIGYSEFRVALEFDGTSWHATRILGARLQ